MEADDLEHRLNLIKFQITGLQEDIRRQHDFSLDLLEKLGQVRDRIDTYIGDNDEIRDVIGEKLFMMFYKVFPEAAEMDKALERVVKAQKKKPKE